MTIEAQIICDSEGEHSPRLTTFLIRHPKFIHAEFCRHRSFSLSASSSRAIPVSKNLTEVRSDELRAAPVWWGREQRGMASGEELDEQTKAFAESDWESAALMAVENAESMIARGVHKSIVNRILEPFLHINVVATSCEPGLMNFFGLRLDKAAQPEIRVLAEEMWKCWNESAPLMLTPGEWHLPFVGIPGKFTDADWADHRSICEISPTAHDDPTLYCEYEKKISAARCARTSYLSFDTGKRSTIEEDLALYEKLAGASPMHLSPLEHQATPDEAEHTFISSGDVAVWADPEWHGNLPGWIQFRKTIPGEAVAPLPEEYRHCPLPWGGP